MSLITPAPPTPQPTVSPVEWAGDPKQCPPGVGYPSRQCLPAGLLWSGAGDVPAIGARVHIYMNSFGPAEVRAYFHREGYLGVLCAPDQMPDWYQKQAPGVTLGHFYGKELEPRRATPTPAAALAQDDEPQDDNQDSTEYPEYPEEEQRD